MPKSAQEDELIEECCDGLNEAIKDVKGDSNFIVLGDWNAVVGEGAEKGVVDPFGLGERNDRGDRLVQFCIGKKQVIANTLFQHHPRRRYTWKFPGDQRRYQIDLILVKHRFRN